MLLSNVCLAIKGASVSSLEKPHSVWIIAEAPNSLFTYATLVFVWAYFVAQSLQEMS